MNTKKTLLFSMLLFAVSLPALAQEKAGGQRRARPGSEQMITAMKERLDLSEDQVVKIREIYKKSREEFGKFRQENAEANDQQREKLRELRKKQQQDIHAVLTEEQQKELKAWREERQQGQRRRPRPDSQ
ncbi:hypothetical protein EDD80_102369 [Anseongella ginsenosidimutans]|uniref:Spy/CpxP family protein refolding chaperone n=1 Tax=Anseongella ginsenosidimutans TaxID=496056 RepID=A0A4R3KV38_9SPHI|nr:hypothetical protein [Anseongella ginsenosidimutans]QEC51804.1 hypothetical protein FRZ59_05260 [Anseongella ginsenosidimutans]TCS89175.1 hypothetical protein EDD80_102369 [Anseongella ginsenosidimutans]